MFRLDLILKLLENSAVRSGAVSLGRARILVPWFFCHVFWPGFHLVLFFWSTLPSTFPYPSVVNSSDVCAAAEESAMVNGKAQQHKARYPASGEMVCAKRRLLL